MKTASRHGVTTVLQNTDTKNGGASRFEKLLICEIDHDMFLIMHNYRCGYGKCSSVGFPVAFDFMNVTVTPVSPRSMLNPSVSSFRI